MANRWQTIAKGLLWIPVGVTVNDMFLSTAAVKGRSMQPVLNAGMDGHSKRDRVLLDKFSIQVLHRYNRGDVVVLASPTEKGEYIVKRLMAKEGDLVFDMHGNRQLIPRGCCWVEGDNASHSEDSNTFGPLPLALIDSRVVAVIWPLHHLKIVQNAVSPDRVVE